MSAVIIPIVSAALPYIPALVTDVIGLFKKYPQFTPDQIVAMVTATSKMADTEFDDAVNTLAPYLSPVTPATPIAGKQP